jgi:hypothetical protein
VGDVELVDRMSRDERDRIAGGIDHWRSALLHPAVVNIRAYAFDRPCLAVEHEHIRQQVDVF